MTSIGWLHLADLHTTLRRPGWTSPSIRRAVFDDLAELHEKAGPWDLLIVAGDLTMRGVPEEIEEAEEAFSALLAYLRKLGSDPCLLAVPGNHDLVRTNGAESAYRALRRWHDDDRVRREFWNDPESPARRLVDRALEPFEKWWNAREFPEHVKVRRGMLPGDFTATIEKNGIRFGVAGLCSAFLQVTGDAYEGRLGLSPLQLTIAAGGDVPTWVAKHDAVVLLTHHAPDWLAEEDRQRYEATINPAGRFAAHLSAHLHEAAPLVHAGERVQVRCPAFFGLDAWEDRRGQPGARRHGYVAARLEIQEHDAELRVFPRVWSKEALRPAYALADLDPDGAVTLPVRRFLRLRDRAAGSLLERAALRDVLAAIYGSPDDARRLAREAGMRLDKRIQAGAAIDVWHVVVSEAERRGRLADLVSIARIEYPSHRALADAWSTYERAKSPSRATLTRRVEAETKLSDTLHEQLSRLHPAAFDAVVSLLALDDEVPGSDAPQTTRAIAVARLAERDGLTGLERLAAVVMHVQGYAPKQPQQIDNVGVGAWLPLIAGGVAVGAAIGLVAAAVLQPGARPRTPTKPSLTKLLTVMFTDERDFDGFVLDHFPAVYRRFTNGMNRAYRIRLLLDAADPAEIVARLKRSHPSAFAAHGRVLDYEDAA